MKLTRCFMVRKLNKMNIFELAKTRNIIDSQSLDLYDCINLFRSVNGDYDKWIMRVPLSQFEASQFVFNSLKVLTETELNELAYSLISKYE